MEDLTGKQLGPYQLNKQMGEGGMATVYKAYQASMDRYVALKILPSHFANDPQFSQRFLQEAKVIAKLEHPNILPVHDFGKSGNYTYLVMRLVEGGCLSDLMHGPPLSFSEINRVISQVGSALDYAHRNGVIHRDIKPANILIDQLGNCLLTDFGVAKMVESSSHLTKTGGILGTPAYISPEQGMGQKIDHRTDIYSLGVILYQMVVGILPYNAETPMAVVIKHIHDPLPPPSQRCPTIPEAIEQVILKALTKKPIDRFDTAGTMVTALDKAISSLPNAGKETIASFTSTQTEKTIAQNSSPDEATRTFPAQQPSNSTPTTVDVNKKSFLVPLAAAALTALLCLGTVYLYRHDLLPKILTSPFTNQTVIQQPYTSDTPPSTPHQIPEPSTTPTKGSLINANLPLLTAGEYNSVIFFKTNNGSDHKFTKFFLDTSNQNNKIIIHSTELEGLELTPETTIPLKSEDKKWSISLPIRTGEHSGRSFKILLSQKESIIHGTVDLIPSSSKPTHFEAQFIASNDPYFNLLDHNPYQVTQFANQQSVNKRLPTPPIDRISRPDNSVDIKLMLLFHDSKPTATVTFNGKTLAAEHVYWSPEKHPSLEFHYEHQRGMFHLTGDLFRSDPAHSETNDFILLGHIDSEKKFGRVIKRKEFDYTLRLQNSSNNNQVSGEWHGWAVSLTPEEHLPFIGEASTIKIALRSTINKGAVINKDPSVHSDLMTIKKIKRSGNLWIARANGRWYLLLEDPEESQKVMIRSHKGNSFIGLKPFVPRPFN